MDIKVLHMDLKYGIHRNRTQNCSHFTTCPEKRRNEVSKIINTERCTTPLNYKFITVFKNTKLRSFALYRNLIMPTNKLGYIINLCHNHMMVQDDVGSSSEIW